MRIHLEEWCEDNSACVSKLKGGEQLRQDLVFAEVLREGIQIITEILEELPFLSRFFNLNMIVLERNGYHE